MSTSPISAFCLIVLVLGSLMQPALAYKDGAFPGKGSIQAWHKANDQYNQACDLLTAGKYDEAIAKDRAALAIYPYDGDYWGNIGDCLGFKKDTKGEEAAYKKAGSLNPDDWKAWDSLGRIYNDQGHDAESKDAFVHALRCNPPAQKVVELETNIRALDDEMDKHPEKRH